MAAPTSSPHRTVVTLAVTTVSFVLVAAGILILVGAFEIPKEGYEFWRDLVKEIGSAVLGIGLLGLAWELAARRAFLHEILALTNMAKQLEVAGIILVTNQYVRDVDWRRLFETNDSLDLFFAYARTWRNSFDPEIREFSARQGRSLRVILPDPSDDAVMGELASRFGSSKGEVRIAVEESAAFFAQLALGNPAGAKVEVLVVPACPLFSFYLFRDMAVLTMASHQKKRVRVPTFLVERGKLMYNYLQEEFNSLRERAHPFTPSQHAPPVAPPANP